MPDFRSLIDRTGQLFLFSWAGKIRVRESRTAIGHAAGPETGRCQRSFSEVRTAVSHTLALSPLNKRTLSPHKR